MRKLCRKPKFKKLPQGEPCPLYLLDHGGLGPPYGNLRFNEARH